MFGQGGDTYHSFIVGAWMDRCTRLSGKNQRIVAKICRDVILNWVSHSFLFFSFGMSFSRFRRGSRSVRASSFVLHKGFFSSEFESVFKRKILVPKRCLPKGMYNNISDACVCIALLDTDTSHSLKVEGRISAAYRYGN